MELIEKLSPYLPYGLKGVLISDLSEDYIFNDGLEDYDYKFKKGVVWQLGGYADPGEIENFLWRNDMTYACLGSKIKPILRPLSDLTKPIKHEGEEFVPKNKIGGDYAKLYGTTPTFTIDEDYREWSVYEFHECLKLRFDVFGMIESGEAIDVTTLETNPYEEE